MCFRKDGEVMALFDKIRGKNIVLEPKEVPEYKAKISDEDMRIMRHEIAVTDSQKTKEELALDLVQSILASPISEKPKEEKKTDNKIEPKVVKQVTKTIINNKETVAEKKTVLKTNNVNTIKQKEIESPTTTVVIVGQTKNPSIKTESIEEKKEDKVNNTGVVIVGTDMVTKIDSNVSKEEEAKKNVFVVESQKEEVIVPLHEIILIEDDYILNNNLPIEERHNIIYI